MYYLPDPNDPILPSFARACTRLRLGIDPFPLRGRETSRTSDCSSQCGGILPLKGELEGVYDRSHDWSGR